MAFMMRFLLPATSLLACTAFDPSGLGAEVWEDEDCTAENESCSVSLRQLRGEKTWENLAEFSEELDEQEEDSNGSSYGERSFYVYRSKTWDKYEDTNVNMANLAGVLWYLHNEVVGHCPRKFGITRVIRYKITMKPTEELQRSHSNFARLCHFDRGQCTGPESSLNDYKKYGYVPGCDKPNHGVANYPDATWYSFPGECPTRPIGAKSSGCIHNQKGGLCKRGEPWSKTCTWRREYAGQLTLDQITSNHNFEKSCKKGFYEYNIQNDKGQGSNFWHGKKDRNVCSRRIHWVASLFAKHFPLYPRLAPPPMCKWGDRQR